MALFIVKGSLNGVLLHLCMKGLWTIVTVSIFKHYKADHQSILLVLLAASSMDSGQS